MDSCLVLEGTIDDAWLLSWLPVKRSPSMMTGFRCL